MHYFVYVKFIEDDVKKVTTSRDVKSFHPQHIEDFSTGTVYRVFWEEDDKTKGGYYDAELLHMTESKEDMDDFIRDKAQRHKVKRKPHAQDSSKNKKKLREAAKQSAAVQILDDISGETNRQVIADLKNENAEIRKENVELRRLNTGLQGQLLDCLSARVSPGTAASPDTAAAPMTSPMAAAVTLLGKQDRQASLCSMDGEASMIPRTAMQPNMHSRTATVNPGIAVSPGIAAAPMTSPVAAAVTSLGTQDRQASLSSMNGEASMIPRTETAHSLCANNLDKVPAACKFTEDGKVHLANGVHITQDAYKNVMAVTRDATFVKKAATSIWTTEALAERSFTGTLSNRYAGEGERVPQKQLSRHNVEALRVFFTHYGRQRGYTPEEVEKGSKNIRLWLSQKTCELRRRRPNHSK